MCSQVDLGESMAAVIMVVPLLPRLREEGSVWCGQDLACILLGCGPSIVVFVDVGQDEGQTCYGCRAVPHLCVAA